MQTASDTSVHRAVIDASVAVKWFCDEPGTHKAETVLERLYAGTITAYVPDLIFYEIGNALWKGKKFSKKQIENALTLLMDLPLSVLALDRELAISTVHFMTAYDITFYDAVYAAIAHHYNVTLITENPKDHKKIREVQVHTLSEFP